MIMPKSYRNKGYSDRRAFDDIVGIRASEMPQELDRYAKKWVRLDNNAVLAAIIENDSTPYSAIELIVKEKWGNIDMLRIAYKHKNANVTLKEKIKKKLDKNVEPYFQAFLPG